MSSVSLSIAIQHAPWSEARRARVNAIWNVLSPAFQRGELAALSVIEDTARAGCAPTARRCLLEAFNAKATHHLVLQDDTIICPDFAVGALAALTVKAEVPVCFYANRKIVEEVRAAGDSWVVIPDGAWGQAICLPIPLIAEYLEWDKAHIDPSFFSYDARIDAFLLATSRPVWCTVPSLVEHAEPGASLMGHSNKRRVARWFIGERVSPLGIDWTRGADGRHKGTGCSFQSHTAKWPGMFK